LAFLAGVEENLRFSERPLDAVAPGGVGLGVLELSLNALQHRRRGGPLLERDRSAAATSPPATALATPTATLSGTLASALTIAGLSSRLGLGAGGAQENENDSQR
jgi:hypothetical protein